VFQDCVELEQHNVTAFKTTAFTVDAPVALELGHFIPLYDADA
tara:strand:- start:610 stop:738 length:129 start_codon:yes stop_codon:yes gene_type:complete